MKKHIPNAITITSLIFSCSAILLTFENRLDIAAYLLIFSCAFDFFDGFAARVLKVNNPIGKEIDSLVDVIAFGVAPSMLLYQYINLLQSEQPVQILTDYPLIVYSIVFLIPILSTLRLAKYNIDTSQRTGFIGLAVPANASFYIFFVLLYLYPDLPKIIDVKNIIHPIVSNPLIVLALSLFFSLMLISNVPMFSLKFKTLKWKENKMPFTFILLWLTMLLFMNIVAMPAILFIYVVVSIFIHFKNPSKVTV